MFSIYMIWNFAIIQILIQEYTQNLMQIKLKLKICEKHAKKFFQWTDRPSHWRETSEAASVMLSWVRYTQICLILPMKLWNMCTGLLLQGKIILLYVGSSFICTICYWFLFYLAMEMIPCICTNIGTNILCEILIHVIKGHLIFSETSETASVMLSWVSGWD